MTTPGPLALRAVFFDFAGTLFDDRALRDAHLAQLRFVADAVGAAPGDRALRAAYRRGLGRAYQAIAPRPFYLHDELFAAAFSAMAEDLGGHLGDGVADEAVRRQYAATLEHARLRPGALATMTTLGDRGLHLGLVSNMDNVQLVPLAERLGLLDVMDAVTTSEDARSCKPDERIYRVALASAGCRPAEALFVGDSLGHDVEGPARLGLRTALLAPSGPPELADGARPDAVIGELPELVGLVDRTAIEHSARRRAMAPQKTTSLRVVMPGPGEPVQLHEYSVAGPGPGEVLVRVRACSLNYHDLVNFLGLLDGPWPRVPLSDAAGEVVAIGPEVENLQVGDRVLSTFYPDWLAGAPTREGKRTVPGDRADGWLQQYRSARAVSLVRVPEHLSYGEAAALPCAATTAWSALEEGRVGAGDVVVTQGTGGVSLFVVQLAAARGATVVLTSSSDRKLQVGRDLGAQHLVNYRTSPEWAGEVRRYTAGAGVDLVVDIGGSGTLAQSLQCLRTGGTAAVVGVLAGAGTAELPVSTVMTRNLRLVGVTVGSVEAQQQLCGAVTQAGLRPHVHTTAGWDELDAAVATMREGQHMGKIVIEVP